MMKNILGVLALFLVIGWVLTTRETVSAQSSRVQELEAENAELTEKLDNIESLVAEAKSDLDDVETDVQTDEPCEDTSAYSNASDVEDKLNEIESEASH
jgi:predicted nuclease with TOPRIM domain